jgi:lysophospholipase L1-like esterase
MRLSPLFSFCWASVVLLACNKHDANPKPPTLSYPEPEAVTSLGTNPAEAAGSTLSDGAGDAGASEVPNPALGRGHSPEEPNPRSISRSVAAAATPNSCRVLALGDSLTDPSSNGGGYLKGWTQRCAHCQFTNLAHGGAMVNQMLRTLREHLSTSPADYTSVVVFGGVNDLYSDQTAHRTLERIERDLSAIYRLARGHSTTVIAITVAPWGGFHRWYTEERGHNTYALNHWIVERQALGEVNAVVDSFPVLSCGNPEQLCPAYMPPYRDGLHFGPEGHRRLSDALLRVLGDGC